MEAHAEIGYGMLQGSSEELLDLAATIAWTHRERVDGAGYPRGLAGDDWAKRRPEGRPRSLECLRICADGLLYAAHMP